MSVGQRIPLASRTWPVLRVLEASHVLLHEAADPGRVRGLVQAFRRDGVLRNPPIVAPAPAGRGATRSAHGPAVVLDGANRVTALREIGVEHIAVQVVQYDAPEIAVSTWTHYVIEDGGPLRRRLAARVGDGAVATTGDEARHRLEQRECVAVLVDADGALVIGPRADLMTHVGWLDAVVGVYAGTAHVYRSESTDLDGLRAEFGPGAAVQFPPLGKDDILRLAVNGRRLPAGITRHLIPGRVLRLNVPLASLDGPEPAAVKQSRLDQAVQERLRAHGTRYYAESTYLFDE